MATTTAIYQNTVIAPTGGVNPFAGQGQTYQLTLAYTGTAAKVTLIFNGQQTGTQYQFGYGFVTGLNPIYSFTYNNKIYILQGATTNFCALNEPTVWNNPQGNFNGFVTMSDYYATQANLVSVAAYQGRLAYFSNYTIQFWIIDPNPASWQQAQVLTNVGTFATKSVASLGDLDVLFLDYNGIRSLRVRDSSLNAFVNDIGSPIDKLIQTTLQQSGIPAASAACSITDPNTGRYWLFIPNTSDANGVGKIYVLSYYPGNKIVGWSTYDPSYLVNGTVTYFTPQLFTIFKGQIWCRATTGGLFLFGGSGGSTFDAITATVQVPFFDMRHPAHNKIAQAIDVDISNGTWNIYATSDWINDTFTQTNAAAQATYDQGWIPFSSQGTHFSMKATTTSATAATLSSLVLHYALGEEPVQ
jgi:hypothetical protein